MDRNIQRGMKNAENCPQNILDSIKSRKIAHHVIFFPLWQQKLPHQPVPSLEVLQWAPRTVDTRRPWKGTNFTGHFPRYFPLESDSNWASIHICTGKKGVFLNNKSMYIKSKYELTYMWLQSCVRPLSLQATALFLPELGGPWSRIPIPQTCRPTKQTLLLNNSNKSVDAHQHFLVFHQRNIMSRGKIPQKGLRREIPMS